MKLLSTLGVKGVLDVVMAPYAARAGFAVEASYDPTARMLERIRGGERADATILTREGIAALTAEGLLEASGQVELARSLVGLGVPMGAPKPDISTPEAARRVLLEVPSIAYSRKGQSGIFFAGLIERLGIADAINAKARIIDTGVTAKLAATGEVAMAVQQVSELMLVRGVDVVGPLPDSMQDDCVFAGAVFKGAPEAAAARGLLAELASAAQADVYRQKGLEPIA